MSDTGLVMGLSNSTDTDTGTGQWSGTEKCMQPFQVGTGMALAHTWQILVNLNWTPVTVLGEYWPDTGQFLQQQHLKMDNPPASGRCRRAWTFFECLPHG